MKRKILFGCIIAVLLAVLVYSGYQVVTIASEYKEGSDSYQELNQFIVVPDATKAAVKNGPTSMPDLQIAGMNTPAPQATPEPGAKLTPVHEHKSNLSESGFVFPEVDFDALYAINDDVVGWIYISGTQISYPVVQGEDNDYYLERLMNGRSNGSGTIFMDYRNDPGVWDRNTILYGHHMQNGTMFAKLVGYKKQAFYDEHPFFQFLTPDVNFQFDVVAAYVSRPDLNAWDVDFASDEAVASWIDTALKRSLIDTGYTYTPGDQFMTLSTCTYEFNNARFVVVGVARWN